MSSSYFVEHLCEIFISYRSSLVRIQGGDIEMKADQSSWQQHALESRTSTHTIARQAHFCILPYLGMPYSIYNALGHYRDQFHMCKWAGTKARCKLH